MGISVIVRMWNERWKREKNKVKRRGRKKGKEREMEIDARIYNIVFSGDELVYLIVLL